MAALGEAEEERLSSKTICGLRSYKNGGQIYFKSNKLMNSVIPDDFLQPLAFLSRKSLLVFPAANQLLPNENSVYYVSPFIEAGGEVPHFAFTDTRHRHHPEGEVTLLRLLKI